MPHEKSRDRLPMKRSLFFYPASIYWKRTSER